MTGGLRSVVATDIVQLSMALGGTLLYACIVWYHVGGFGALTEQLVELYGAEAASSMVSFAPPGGEMLLPFLAIIGMQWFFQVNSDGSGYLAQRAMACATDRDARIASLVFTWVQIVARSLLWLVIGVGLLVIYPFAPLTPNLSSDAAFTTSREMLFVTGINDLLPVGIRGVMFVGLLAALASTIDTHLNWGASYWSNDIYQRLICHHWLRRKPDNHELVVVARLSNVLILIIALTLMAHLGSIQQAWFVSLLFGAGVGSVLVLRWLWERITLFSELAAMAVSLVVAPILLITTDAEWLHLAVMGVVSTGVAIGITYVTPGTADDVLNRFYQQVRPMGFWSNTARRMGDPPQLPVRQLGQALKITLLLALSVFFDADWARETDAALTWRVESMGLDSPRDCSRAYSSLVARRGEPTSHTYHASKSTPLKTVPAGLADLKRTRCGIKYHRTVCHGCFLGVMDIPHKRGPYKPRRRPWTSL